MQQLHAWCRQVKTCRSWLLNPWLQVCLDSAHNQACVFVWLMAPLSGSHGSAFTQKRLSALTCLILAVPLVMSAGTWALGASAACLLLLMVVGLTLRSQHCILWFVGAVALSAGLLSVVLSFTLGHMRMEAVCCSLLSTMCVQSTVMLCWSASSACRPSY